MSVNIHIAENTGHVSFDEVKRLPNGQSMHRSEEKSEIEIGTLQMQILWALSRKSMHGYELMKALSAIKGTPVTQGTLYPTVKRLVKLKLAERHAENTGDRKKYIYNLTPKGFTTMNNACLEFVKTFYGIFHDFACEKCSLYKKGDHSGCSHHKISKEV